MNLSPSGLVCVLSALVVFLISATGKAQEPVAVEGEGSVTGLGLHLEILEDEGGRWTIDQVSSPGFEGRFQPSRTEIPNFGFSSSAFWIRFALDSKLAQRDRFLLEISYPLLDRLAIYLERTGGGFDRRVLGDRLAYGNKPIRYYTFVVPIDLDPGTPRRIYLRIQTEGAVLLPLRLWTESSFQEHAHRTQIAYGIYFGLLIFILLYNLFLYLSIRDRSYLYCVLYILGALVYQSTMEGLPQERLWPGLPWWGNRVLPFSSHATLLFAQLFALEFLRIRDNLPRWYPWILALVAITSVGMVGSLFLPYNLITIIVAVNAVISSCLGCVISVVVWRRGFKPARLYIAAWVAWIVGACMLALSRLGVLPKTVLTDNAHLFGFACNAVLFSIALAERINLLKQQQAQAQDKLARTYEQLAEYNRLRSDFFSNVSHELLSPLTLILSPLEDLVFDQTNGLPDPVRQRLRSMMGNTQRLLRLVNQLLDFTKIETKKMELVLELCDVRRFAEPIVEAFEPLAESKGLRLELRGAVDLPRVYVDPGKLDKVLCNLLSNACKFTDEGGSVVVEITSIDRFVRIMVRDTGVGIDEEHLTAIFERFRRLDSGQTRRSEGTGIGLALSKELVEMTGGSLEVTSEPGVGSTFTVLLPLGSDHIRDPHLIQPASGEALELPRSEAGATALATAAETMALQSPSDRAPGSSAIDRPPDERPLLLLVEDNLEMLALAAEICGEDFRIIQATDGQAATELLRIHRPELVISDVMMPRMDGYQLLEWIRSRPETRTIPVMMLTAKATTEMRMEGLESGADDYLAKPFDARELVARARNLVRLKQQERQLRELNAKLQQEILDQATTLERTAMLRAYLPPAVSKAILSGDQQLLQGHRQRRSLTVFQMALRGMERMVADVEPEQLTAMLNGYLSLAVDIAFEHGATVDKFRRDRIVGFFGAPTSEGAKEDAIRCVRMARQLWRGVTQFCERYQAFVEDDPPLPTIVISSGFATVGTFGSPSRLDYTAVGVPVTQSRALLDAVSPGAVFCTSSTWALIQGSEEALPDEMVQPRRGNHAVKMYRIELGVG